MSFPKTLPSIRVEKVGFHDKNLFFILKIAMTNVCHGTNNLQDAITIHCLAIPKNIYVLTIHCNAIPKNIYASTIHCNAIPKNIYASTIPCDAILKLIYASTRVGEGIQIFWVALMKIWLSGNIFFCNRSTVEGAVRIIFLR